MYGLVSIVKNERASIGSMLESVKELISSWTVVDTGSTDGTQEIVREVLADIPGQLIERPWVNFGVNRSEAFTLARGTADWLLALDADCTVEVDPDFVPDPAVDAYMIQLGGPSFSWRLPVLLNGHRAWKSVGAVHEYTVLMDGLLGRREPTDAVRITHHGAGRSSPEKSRWHLDLLREDLVRDPNNPRTVFYIAQTHADLGETGRAREWYGKRAKMGGFVEEALVAAYRAALLTEWPERRDALWAAWMIRPSRLEPAYALARGLNEHGDHSTAYAVSSVPPRPSGDVLFVEGAAWAHGLDFERSIAAWWTGRYDEAARLGSDLLTRDLPGPIREAVERNLKFGPREG